MSAFCRGGNFCHRVEAFLHGIEMLIIELRRFAKTREANLSKNSRVDMGEQCGTNRVKCVDSRNRSFDQTV